MSAQDEIIEEGSGNVVFGQAHYLAIQSLYKSNYFSISG